MYYIYIATIHVILLSHPILYDMHTREKRLCRCTSRRPRRKRPCCIKALALWTSCQRLRRRLFGALTRSIYSMMFALCSKGKYEASKPSDELSGARLAVRLAGRSCPLALLKLSAWQLGAKPVKGATFRLRGPLVTFARKTIKLSNRKTV